MLGIGTYTDTSIGANLLATNRQSSQYARAQPAPPPNPLLNLSTSLLFQLQTDSHSGTVITTPVSKTKAAPEATTHGPETQ